MAKKRYFNWKLATVLVLALAVLVVTAFGLRHWRRSHLAEQGLTTGTQAFEKGQWEEAARGLGQYLARVPDDVPILFKYAETQLNIRPLKQANINQALAAYRDILRYDEGNPEASVKLVEMYLQMNVPGEAKLVAEQNLPKRSNPELRTLLALARIQLNDIAAAYTELQDLIQKHPAQISAYEILGRLVAQHPKEYPDSSEEYWLHEAVAKNPEIAYAYIRRAAFYLRQNDKENARQDLAHAQTLDISDSAVHLRLTQALIQADQLDQAEAHLKQIQTAEPQNVLLWQMWAQWAQKKNDPSQMQRLADEGLQALGYKKLDFMPIAIELFFQSEQFERATACIAEMRQQDLTYSILDYYEGLIAAQQNKPNLAISYLRKALALEKIQASGSQQNRYRFALIRVFKQSGDTLSAIHQLRSLILAYPENLTARLELAHTLLAMGNWEDAAREARVARERFGDSLAAVLLQIRARMAGLTQQKNAADSAVLQNLANELAALAKAAPEYLEIKMLQAQLALQQQDYQQAEQLIQSAKSEHPDNLSLAMVEVNTLIMQNKTEVAVARLRELITENPHSTAPVRILASLLAEQDQKIEAEQIIRQALERVTESPAQQELTFLLADLYEQGEQLDKAVSLLDSFLQNQPDNIPAIRKLLGYEPISKNTVRAHELVNRIRTIEGDEGRRWRCEQVRLWLRSNNFEDRYTQSVSLLKKNLSSYPDDLDSRMLLATAYERTGEQTLAVTAYRQAYERAPNNMSVVLATVAALHRARETEEAKEIINRSTQILPKDAKLSQLELQNYLFRGQWDAGLTVLEEMVSQNPENQQEYLLLKANLLARSNQWQQAEEILLELRKKAPDSLPASAALVDVYLQQDKNDQALAICHEMVDTMQTAPALVLRARTYLRLERFDHAGKDFSQALTLAPENPAIWSAKAEFHLLRGQTDLATEAVKKALTFAPESLSIRKQAIPLHLADENPDIRQAGEKLLETSLQTYPKDSDLRLWKARLLLANGTAPSLNQAKKMLEEITRDNPELIEAWLRLGNLALRQNQSDDALNYAMKGLVYSRNHPQLLLLKAEAEKETNLEIAIETLLRLRNLYPDDIGFVLNLADKYILAQQADKAVGLLESVWPSAEGKNRKNVRIALAAARYESGDRQKALQQLDELYQEDPNDPYPVMTQARLLRKGKQWDLLRQKFPNWYLSYSKGADLLQIIANELAAAALPEAIDCARQIYQFILEKDPKNTRTLQTLAILYQETTQINEAAALYEKLLQIDPDNLVAINNYAWLLCENKQQYQKALELAIRGLEKAPNYIDLIDTRGMIYYRLQQHQNAATDFQKCVNLYPPMAPALTSSHFHLGRTFAQLGQKTQALAHLQEALNLQEKNQGLSETDLNELRDIQQKLTEGE